MMRHFDLIVAGFGTAGTIAAIAAARKGASVLAIERTHYAGGTHTGGFVQSYYIQKPVGLMKELHEKLQSEQEKSGCSFRDFEENKSILETEALRYGVEILYGASVIGVLKNGNTVTGVRYLTEDHLQHEVSAHTVIDATADGTVCAMAEAQFRAGREFDGQFMPFTNSMLCQRRPDDVGLANLDAGRINQYREPEYSQTLLRCFLNHLADDFRTRIPYLLCSDLPGIREGRNIIPEGHCFTLAEVLDGSEDAKEPIGYVWSNLDTHANDFALESELFRDWMIGCSMWGVQLFFPVPRNAMQPEGLRGLLVAGRHLGVDHDLACALRMNPLMGMIGEAAGLFAAAAAKAGIDASQIPYSAVAPELDLPEDPLEYNRKLWLTKESEILGALDSDQPGIAMWSARRNLPITALQTAYRQAVPGSRLRRHLAMTLALQGDKSGAEELRTMVRERDPYVPSNSRKYNHCRGYVSLCLLGNLADPETVELAGEVLADDTIAEHRYEYHTHALAALLRIGDAHPQYRKRAAELLKPVLENPDWQISSRLKGTKDTMKRMDAIFRCAGAVKLSAWRIPHRIGEALQAAGPDEYELDLARRLGVL